MSKIKNWEDRLRGMLYNNVEEIVGYLPDNFTMIDIGANTGLFTKMILEKKPNYKLIHMFEPIGEYADECMMKFYSYDKIYVHQLGMSYKTETQMIKLDSQNLGYNKIGEDGTLEINLIRFSDFANDLKIKDIDFIKIDTEGYDTKVLEGMKEWIQSVEKKPIILFEKGWDLDDERNSIEDYISNYGYNEMIELQYDYILIPKGAGDN